jgi:hypothetical protein
MSFLFKNSVFEIEKQNDIYILKIMEDNIYSDILQKSISNIISIKSYNLNNTNNTNNFEYHNFEYHNYEMSNIKSITTLSDYISNRVNNKLTYLECIDLLKCIGTQLIYLDYQGLIYAYLSLNDIILINNKHFLYLGDHYNKVNNLYESDIETGSDSDSDYNNNDNHNDNNNDNDNDSDNDNDNDSDNDDNILFGGKNIYSDSKRLLQKNNYDKIILSKILPFKNNNYSDSNLNKDINDENTNYIKNIKSPYFYSKELINISKIPTEINRNIWVYAFGLLLYYCYVGENHISLDSKPKSIIASLNKYIPDTKLYFCIKRCLNQNVLLYI